ncbi:MAG: hypothetical protein KDH20_13945 [Rhodocyclaceae bacterium]|nr:hypothetical protein [Rhodocyclaceae bacterium]
MRIVAECQDLGGGLIVSSLFAENCRGAVVRTVTDFLLEFVSELSLSDLASVEGMLSRESQLDGGDIPLFEMNGKTAWIRTQSGFPPALLVANEYAPDKSDVDAAPKEFDFGLVRASLSVWRSLREAELEFGREGVIGSRFEIVHEPDSC